MAAQRKPGCPSQSKPENGSSDYSTLGGEGRRLPHARQPGCRLSHFQASRESGVAGVLGGSMAAPRKPSCPSQSKPDNGSSDYSTLGGEWRRLPHPRQPALGFGANPERVTVAARCDDPAP